jgi:hypothetical protein
MADYIDLNKLRVTLRKHLLELDTKLPDSRAWENKAFTRPTNNNFIREKLQLSDERLIANKTVQGIGFYVISVFAPKGSGTKEITEVSNEIVGKFKPAQSIQSTDSTLNISIDRAERTNVLDHDKKWSFMNVRITWRAYATLS